MDVRNLKKLLISPIVFNDINIEIIDVIDACHTAGQVAGPHRHPWYEFNYITSGHMNISFGNNSFVVEPDNFILVPANTEHSNYWDIGDDGVCIRFALQKNPEARNTGCYDELSSILKEDHPFSEKIDMSSFLENKSQYALQSAFINLLFRISEIYEPNIIIDKLSVESNISSQVILYLNEYYHKKIYVDDIAKALNMSYRALAKHFKAETGMSIIEKLNEIRLNEAKRLLRKTDYTLAQIAEMTGFEDESYFSKAFTKYVQCPPSRFRK